MDKFKDNPQYTRSLTVVPSATTEKTDGPYETLASLKIGEKGQVVGISRACRRQQRTRLMDLGVVPGTVITAEMKSPGGDPVAYNIRGAAIALRKEQAEMIYIRRLKEK